MSIHRVKPDWKKIDDHKPPECIKLMITGPSYHAGGGIRANYLLTAYYDEEFRPSHGGKLRWQTVNNDAVTDEYPQPTHWAYLPIFPEE